MGDMADDAFDSAFEMDTDIKIALRAMRDECDAPLCRQNCIWNDDGLLECTECRRTTDV